MTARTVSLAQHLAATIVIFALFALSPIAIGLGLGAMIIAILTKDEDA